MHELFGCLRLFSRYRQFGHGLVFHVARWKWRPNKIQTHGTGFSDTRRRFNFALCLYSFVLAGRLDSTYRHTTRGLKATCRITKQKGTSRCLFFIIQALHPVHQDVQTQPDHIHEVPIPCRTFKTKMALGAEVTFL